MQTVGDRGGSGSQPGGAPSRALIASARELLRRAELGEAVVVAQAAAEVAMAAAVGAALTRSVDGALAGWITRRDVRGQSFSADSDRIQALWTALTGDRLVEASWWPSYAEGVRARDRFVHEGKPVDSDQKAESFVDAVERLAQHVLASSQATHVGGA